MGQPSVTIGRDSRRWTARARLDLRSDHARTLLYRTVGAEARYPLDVSRWCSDERTPLLIIPRGGLSREDINRNVSSLWRYRASLPVEIVNPITMGEGCAAVVQKPWGDF